MENRVAPPPSRARQARPASDARRRDILDAALALFLERGYEPTTVEDIRDRSGASIGSIYHHFGGKEDMAAAIYVESLQDYQSGFVRTLQRHPLAREGIRATVRYHLRWIAKNPERARFLFGVREAIGPREAELVAMNRRFFADVFTWVRPHLEAGEVRRLPVDVAYVLWIGPAQEYARNWLGGRAPTGPERAAPVLADAAWDALRARTEE